MANLDIALPSFAADLTSAKEVRALKNYLYMLNEQLRYVLQNLDAGNLSPSLNQSISASAEKSETALAEAELCRTAIEQNREGIRLRVQKGEVVSDINQSPEQVKIRADKIALEGVVTANENFRINPDGSMETVAGQIGGWTIQSGKLVSRSGSNAGVSLDSYNNRISLGGSNAYIAPLAGIYGPTGLYFSGDVVADGDISADDVNGRYADFSSVDATGISCEYLTAWDLHAYGSKQCIQRTEHYGERSFYCYETAAYYLGDIGECAAPGIVRLDPIFAACVRTDMPYQVFLTPYGNGRVWVCERGAEHFAVAGDPIPFAWEIKALRRGFEDKRLDSFHTTATAGRPA